MTELPLTDDKDSDSKRENDRVSDAKEGSTPPDGQKTERSEALDEKEHRSVVIIDKLGEAAESTLDDPIGRLHQSVNIAATTARNAGLTFLLFGLYLTITFGGTTHGQLFRGDPVTVPLLNVDLPLIAFYSVAPTLFVLLHLNFLISAYFLQQKLIPLHKLIENLDTQEKKEQARNLINPFPLAQVLSDTRQQYFTTILIHIFVFSILMISPILVLLIGQARFLPYHHDLTTWYHRFLILIDLGIIGFLWVLRPDHRTGRTANNRQRLQALKSGVDRIKAKSILKSDSWEKIKTRRIIVIDYFKNLEIEKIALRIRTKILKSSTFSPSEYWKRAKKIRFIKLSYWRSLRLHQSDKIKPTERRIFGLLAILSLIVSWLFLTIPSTRLSWLADLIVGPDRGFYLVPRNLQPDDKTTVLARLSPGIIVEAGGDETMAILKYGDGFDLRDRDLRYADLSDMDLRKADLRGANLFGAILDSARLQGADLSPSQHQEVLEPGQETAQPAATDLRFASLRMTDLLGANLSAAKLQGANLFKGGLEGVFAPEAKLQATNLRYARLDAAYLREANLRSADLWHATLRGVDLSDAFVEGADLRRAKLEGVDLRGARFWQNRMDPDLEIVDWTTIDGRGLVLEAPDALEDLAADLAEDLPYHDEKQGTLKRFHCWILGSGAWSDTSADCPKSSIGEPRFAGLPPEFQNEAPDRDKLLDLLNNKTTCYVLARDVSNAQIFKRLDKDESRHVTDPLSGIIQEVLLNECALPERFDRAGERLRIRLESR